MAKHLFFCILIISVLTSCKDEEESHPDQSGTNSSMGRYEYNFIDKDIVDGFVRATGDSILVLTLIDEDNRVMNAQLLDYQNRSTFTFPGGPDELVAQQQFGYNDEDRFLITHGSDTSSIQLANEVVGNNPVSGNFNLSFQNNFGAIVGNWSNGYFNNIPFIEVNGIPADGMDYHYTFNQIFIDSIITRFTNTYKLEAYIYAKRRFGLPVFELIRWNISETGNIIQPDIAYYNPFLGVRCGLMMVGNFSYDPIAERLNSEILEGTELARAIQIKFKDLPVDLFPQAYPDSGQLILYSPDQTVTFTAVSVNTGNAASLILEAENEMGNRIEVTYSDSETNPNLNYAAHKPGAEVELAFYDNSGDNEPSWITSGFMDMENSTNGKVNIGFETSFLPRDTDKIVFRGFEIEP
jgi:hypothetical protein